MVEIFNNWDMDTGKITWMAIKLVHPADNAKTLINIRSQKAFKFEDLNIEELLDCPGLVSLYETGIYACIGNNNEIYEWY
jgi:hypothetical protein